MENGDKNHRRMYTQAKMAGEAQRTPALMGSPKTRGADERADDRLDAHMMLALPLSTLARPWCRKDIGATVEKHTSPCSGEGVWWHTQKS